jgi:hypothetical protein
MKLYQNVPNPLLLLFIDLLVPNHHLNEQQNVYFNFGGFTIFKGIQCSDNFAHTKFLCAHNDATLNFFLHELRSGN